MNLFFFPTLRASGYLCKIDISINMLVEKDFVVVATFFATPKLPFFFGA